MYAEYISFVGTGEIAWVRLNVASTSYLNEADSIRIFLWNGGSEPGSVIASRKIKLREVQSNNELEVDFGRTISVTGSYYVGYKIYYKNKLTLQQTQFAVRHSEPWLLASQNTAWFHDGSGWRPFTLHPGFPMATSLGIKVVMVENSVLNDIEDPEREIPAMTVFPNPFSGTVSFSVKGTGVRETSLKIYNNTGQVVYVSEYRSIFPGVLTIELPWLVPGIYHYGMMNDSVFYSGTLIKAESR